MSDTYESAITLLAERRLRLAQVLRSAEERRRATASALLEGARFKGLEELLTHLDEVAEAFEANPQLNGIALMVLRARGDVESAIEATMSGYTSVAIDAMRDVIEIENLLWDFSIDHSRMQEWLEADAQVLRRQFRPVKVRERLAAAGVGNVGAKAESVDYAGHSAALHVNPMSDPLSRKGLQSHHGFEGDAGFWEIFEHSRRLVGVVDRLWEDLGGPDGRLRRMDDLHDVKDAWSRTQEMQTMFLALWQAAAEVSISDDPVTENVTDGEEA